VPDLLPESINGPDSFCAQQDFEPGEGHLDWIKIETLGRQEQNPSPLARIAFSAALLLRAARLSMMTASPLLSAGASSFSIRSRRCAGSLVHR
jgi:hypothetical protein